MFSRDDYVDLISSNAVIQPDFEDPDVCGTNDGKIGKNYND